LFYPSVSACTADARYGRLSLKLMGGGLELANTQRADVRVEPALIREAAECAGLPESMSPSVIIRYALAVLAGRPNPREVAIVRPGPKPRVEASA
jgi:hypothetical protein